jgi:hypothetical protein
VSESRVSSGHCQGNTITVTVRTRVRHLKQATFVQSCQRMHAAESVNRAIIAVTSSAVRNQIQHILALKTVPAAATHTLALQSTHWHCKAHTGTAKHTLALQSTHWHCKELKNILPHLRIVYDVPDANSVDAMPLSVPSRRFWLQLLWPPNRKGGCARMVTPATLMKQPAAPVNPRGSLSSRRAMTAVTGGRICSSISSSVEHRHVCLGTELCLRNPFLI